jgi:hypothetical protein
MPRHCTCYAQKRNPAALLQVPILVYDRSMFMFGTAFVIDVLSACFELKTSRLDMVLLPAFVKGLATLTNVLVRYGWATIGAAPNGTV